MSKITPIKDFVEDCLEVKDYQFIISHRFLAFASVSEQSIYTKDISINGFVRDFMIFIPGAGYIVIECKVPQVVCDYETIIVLDDEVLKDDPSTKNLIHCERVRYVCNRKLFYSIFVDNDHLLGG